MKHKLSKLIPSITLLLASLGANINASANPLPLISAEDVAKIAKPYMEFKGEQINREDAKIVRVWFSPSCKYSMEYQHFFENLSRTVGQAGMTVEFSPALNLDEKRGAKDGAQWAVTFATIRRYYPQYVLNFINASFAAVQENQLSPLAIENVAKMVRAARLNPNEVFATSVNNQNIIKQDVMRYGALMLQHKIATTPRVTVAGQYEVNPEYVNGDPKNFETVINALISMAVNSI